jgi:ATP-dependent DNA helicase DinG
MYKQDVKLYHKLKYEPRQLQIDALEFTKHQIRRGKKYVMLNMPTGTGKSFFSIMFINWYKNYINKDAKFDILTNTKLLQNQYISEFPFIANLKGKNAYRCNSYPDSSCQEGKEMNKALKKIIKS